MITQAVLHVTSFPLPVVPGYVKTTHGSGLPCRPPLWSHRSTLDRYSPVLSVFLFSQRVFRCASRSFKVTLWQTATFHCYWCSIVLCCDPSIWIRSSSCFFVHKSRLVLSACLLSIYLTDISIWLCQNGSLTIWLAVLSIYCIDFSINAGLSA